MAFLQVNNVEVAGMAAAVPTMVENNVDIYGKWEGYAVPTGFSA